MQNILILFDLDGTLVESFTTKVLPGVKEILQTIRERGISIGICTNQAGPAWRYATGQEKYPTSDRVARNILAIAHELELTDVPWFIAIGDERLLKLEGEKANGSDAINQVHLDLQKALRYSRELPNVQISDSLAWRKPQPGMIQSAMEIFQVTKKTVVVYAGDMTTDEQAAKNAGVHFVYADKLATLLELV